MTPGPGGGRAVVVTGLGATTPLGGDAESTWAAALRGDRAGQVLPWAQGLPVRLGAPMAVDPAARLDRVAARRLDRSQAAALVAAREAWADAGSPQVEPARLAVVVGTGIGGIGSLLAAYDTMRERGPERMSPFTIPMIMPNGPAAWVGLELGARALVQAPVSACASGAEAVVLAARLVAEGRADVAVAGGADACLLPFTLAAFAAMRALSARHDDPAGASRPFDAGRDGFVLGEGAGALVLEAADRAAARGARVHAAYAGGALRADAHHIAQPDPDGAGAAEAVRAALADAGADAADVVHVNAHATSTPLGDMAEARALHAALGDHAAAVAVSATKGATGHLLGGAGAVEAVLAVLALREGVAPPTANLRALDPDVALDVVAGAPRALPPGPVLALDDSFGFGGHDAVVAFRRRTG